MVNQRYERVSGNDADDAHSPISPQSPQLIPNSPPPSFRSRASSPASRRHIPRSSTGSIVDATLEDTFGSDNDEEEIDDRQRLMRAAPQDASADDENSRPELPRTTTQLPQFPTTRPAGASRSAPVNDGVFANINAKPERGEKTEEQPPSYEQAAADATPPYWETTIMAPGMVSDEVFIDGLPVGSFFSFAWNAIISMAFQLVGFLLTYLLHTTHAAKNGSRAGLGITLINYGFTMRTVQERGPQGPGGNPNYSQPTDPDSHDFDPSAVANAAAAAVSADTTVAAGSDSFPGQAWFSYALLIVGWIVLIKSVSDFVKARKHEQLILQSPDRGLNVPVVAEGENAETVA